MIYKCCRWQAALVLALALAAPSQAVAGPYLGDWGWLWHPGPDCPTTDYCWLHYWAPELYQARACCKPSNLDQYPPGPYPPVQPSYIFNRYCCMTTPPTPSAPYANPTGYYGRPVAPP